MNKNVKIAVIVFVIISYIFGNCNTVFSDDVIDGKNLSEKRCDIIFENIDKKNGLSSDYITCIFQDSKGYMWIGTEDGLNQYGGSVVKVFNYNSEDDNSLSSTYVNSIAEDVQGNIWVGTYGGLNIIDSETEMVTRIEADSDSEKGLSNYYITSIYRDTNDVIWVGTANGLNRYDEENDRFIQYYCDDVDISNYIYDIEEDDNKNLWVSTKKGIASININNMESYRNKYSNSNTKEVYGIDRDWLGNMWIATKEGIFKYDLMNDTVSNIINELDINLGSSMNSILADNNGNIWIGSSDGLIVHNEESDSTTIYKSEDHLSNSLRSNTITCIYQDRNEVLWIGTDKGISILNTTQKFQNNINSILKKMSISKNSITSILEDSDNNIWIATEGSGIINFIIETEEAIIYEYKKDNEKSLSSNDVNCIVEIGEGIIMASTSQGIDVIHMETKEVERKITNNRSGDYISKLEKVLDDGSCLWIGSDDGLIKYDINSNNLFNYSGVFEDMEMKSDRVADIFQDESNEDILWLAGGRYTGLIKFHKEYGIIKNYAADGGENSISYDTINCITGDAKGNLWIGTSAGLNKFNIDDETFVSYSEKDGLISSYVTSIVLDDYGNVWVGTNGGLSRFNIEKEKFSNYGEIDGLQGIYFNNGAAVKLECGQILMGTSNGAVSFNPLEISEENNINDPIVISKVRVNGKLINFDDEGLNLKYNENNLTFSYIFPNYGKMGGVTYIHMLEGFDTAWNYTDKNIFANYTLLEPGDYVFKVKAITNSGAMSEEASIKFTIRRPLWKTNEAYCLYFIILIIISNYFWNNMKILKAMVENQTKEINRQMKENKKLYEKSIQNERFKNDYFINLSHELRTPINVILSALQLIKTLEKDGQDNKERTSHYMDIIKRNSNNLLKIINDIIDSSKIESGTYKITKQENVDIVYLVEETALSMSDYINEKGIELIIDPEIEEKIISCDSNEIERCIINIIANAVKFTEEGGKITILIKDYDDKVSISVEDTGMGISKEDQEFIFKRFEQGNNYSSTKVSSSGIGLTLVKYVVELHDGKVDLESEINKGSKFTITLPVS